MNKVWIKANHRALIALASVFALSFALIFSGLSAAVAQTGKLGDIESDISQKRQETNEKEDQSAELGDDISDLQKDIDAQEAVVEKSGQEIADMQNRVEQKIASVKKQQEKLRVQNKRFNRRVRTMYMNGDVGVLEVILGSTSITDFISNLAIVQKIINDDVDMISDIEKKERKLKKEMKALKAEQAELEKQKQQQIAEEEKLVAAQAKVKGEKASVDSDINGLKEEIEALEAESQAIQSMLSGFDDSDVTVGGNGSGGQFSWPFPASHRISSNYGWRWGRMHTGVDIDGFGNAGASIVAAGDGKVIYAGWKGSYGNCVMVSHGGGYVTLYAHLSSISVSNGQFVSRGQRLGGCGSTGNSTGTHLHFEVRVNGSPQNPLGYL